MKQSSMIKKLILILEFVKTATNFGNADTVSNDSSSNLVIDLSYKPNALDSHSQAEALDLSYKPNALDSHSQANAPDSTVTMGSSHLQPINQAIKEVVEEAFKMYFEVTGTYAFYSSDDLLLHIFLSSNLTKRREISCFSPDQLAHRKKLYAAIIATFLVNLEKQRITSQEVSLAEKNWLVSNLFYTLYFRIKNSIEAFKTGIKDIKVDSAYIERVKGILNVLFNDTRIRKKLDIDINEASNSHATKQIEAHINFIFEDQSIKAFINKSVENYKKAIKQLGKDFPSELIRLTPEKVHSFFKVFKGDIKKLTKHKQRILDEIEKVFYKDNKRRAWINKVTINNFFGTDGQPRFKNPYESKYLKAIFFKLLLLLKKSKSKTGFFPREDLIIEILYIASELLNLSVSEELNGHLKILRQSYSPLEIFLSKLDNKNRCENCASKNNTLFCDECINYLYGKLSKFINDDDKRRKLDSIIENDIFLRNVLDELPEHLKAEYKVVLETVRSYPFIPLQLSFVQYLMYLEKGEIKCTAEAFKASAHLFLLSSLNRQFPPEFIIKVDCDCPTTKQIVEYFHQLQNYNSNFCTFKSHFYNLLERLGIRDLTNPFPSRART
ncbi:hypothetical protein GINT2_000912 [Glugoides intestinalis]